MTIPLTVAGRQYDVWASVYDHVWGRYARRTAGELHRRLHLRGDERILDVGCGTAILERRLLNERPSLEIVGLDASKRMLHRARSRLADFPGISFVHGRAELLPFANASFDVVLSASTMHYLRNPVAALREMRRVLTPGGRVVILDWLLAGPVMRLRDAVLSAVDPAHERTLSCLDVRELFEETGLTVKRFESIQAGLYRLYFVEAAPESKQPGA